MRAFLSLFSFWTWLDAAGLLIVLIGVIGEVITGSKECPVEDNESLRRTWEKRNKKIEKRWGCVLITGLALELISFPIHALEAARLSEKAAILANRLEQLRSENLRLEKAIQPRRITDEQREILIRELLGLSGKPRILLTAQSSDIEARVFAIQLKPALQACGFEVTTISGLSVTSADAERVAFGISFAIKQQPITPAMQNVIRAFAQAKIISLPANLSLAPRIAENTLDIQINAKPIE